MNRRDVARFYIAEFLLRIADGICALADWIEPTQISEPPIDNTITGHLNAYHDDDSEIWLMNKAK